MYEREISLFERPLLSFARATPQRMAIVSFSAALVILQSALADRGASCLLAACAVAGSLCAELIVSRVRRQYLLTDLSALCSALVLTLMLPAAINPAFAFLGAFFATGVVKGAFGGLGANWLNPALAGALFVRFSWPGLYTLALTPVDAAVGGAGAENALFSMISAVFGVLNGTVFRLFAAEIPAETAGLLVNASAGIVADRGGLALMLAGIVICAGVHRFFLSALYLGLYLALVWAAGGAENNAAGSAGGDIFHCLFSGGTLVAAFFLIADPSTGAKSQSGKICAALLAALLSFAFRYLKHETYGAFFAVAAVNVLCPVILGEESRRLYNRAITVRGAPQDWSNRREQGGGR
ncbi:MAG: RnfABCDGE type electron transport complex subunit D [Spirochaetaceae bacterium]|jgi:electron transport complex protein RnfD|nr:RnfABCDGE type electron transport complex subunit D [Spirochaetaceae bacterium]